MTRRDVFGLGCAALAALAVPTDAEARPSAPRVTCPHAGCRHHRPAGGGTCALSIRTEVR